MKVSFCRPVLDDDVASFVPPKLAQAVAKGLPHVADCRRHRWGQDADTLKLCLLLRLGHERRGNDAPAHDGDERSPVHHSMTWSARPSTDGGIVRPRAFAGLRLITSSNLVGCWT